MARTKTKSITESMLIMFTPAAGDKEALAYFETKLMRQNYQKDCTTVSNAEILRHALHVAFASDRRSRVVAGVKSGKRFIDQGQGIPE